jgi:hypothetical protein
MTDTEKILIKMLKENTGRAMLDSGSTYGRNWERNQTRKFQREPRAILNINAYHDHKTGKESVELWPTISVYHFLSEALEYSPKIDKQLQAFMRRAEFADTSYLELMKTFAQQYADKQKDTPLIDTVNSYNGEDYLSQVIQYVYIGEYEGIALLQIHGGCDVRGGYTKPRAFRYNSDWDKNLSDNARANICCTSRPCHGWDVEPGYTQGFNGESALDSYPVHILADGETPVIGKLCAREDDSEAFCPICAAKLEAGF